MRSKTEDERNGDGAITFSFQRGLASVPYPGDPVRPYCASSDRQGLILERPLAKRSVRYQMRT